MPGDRFSHGVANLLFVIIPDHVLGDLIHVIKVPPFLHVGRGDFATSCLPPCPLSPFKKESAPQVKNLLPMEAILFLFREDPYQKGNKKILTELLAQ